MVFCHKCGNQNNDSFNFCIHCGAKLKENLIRCTKCGKFNEYDSNFCIDCGNRLNQNTSNVHDKLEKNVKFNNNPYSEILSTVEKILGTNKIKKDNPKSNSNNVKSEHLDNELDNDKNSNEKIDDIIIENYNSPEEKTSIKQKHTSKKIKNEQNTITKDKDIDSLPEVIILPAVETPKCYICGSEILNDDSIKICKSCCTRISNNLNLICDDFEINTKIPLKNLYNSAEYHKLSRKDVGDITTLLLKYEYLHKTDGEIQIDYNEELRNFIDKYSTKTENKNDNIKNKVNLVAEKIGLNTPFDITYLKETLNFKNSEISKMIKYLEEKNAIIEDGDYYILVDNPNDINDNITNIKSELDIETYQKK